MPLMTEEWFITSANHRSSGDPNKIRGVCVVSALRENGWEGVAGYIVSGEIK